MWFLGIDIGTTHIKVVGVTEDDVALRPLRRRTPVQRADGLDFHAGEDVWREVKSLVEEYNSNVAREFGELAGVTIATFGQEEAFPVDTAGKPLFPSLAWWERWPEPSLSPELIEEFDSSSHYAISGVRYRSNQSPDRIAHLQQHEGELWDATYLWVDFGTYVAWKLTGAWVSSATQITHSQLHDLDGFRPDRASFEAMRVDPERFPEVRHIGVAIGEIRNGILSGVKLAESAMVYTGGHDQVIAAYTSVTQTGAAVIDSIGTAEYLMVATQQLRTDVELHAAGVEVAAGWAPGQYMVGWGMPTGKIFQALAALFFDGDFDSLLTAVGAVNANQPFVSVRLNDLRGAPGLFSLDNIAAGATPQAVARQVADQIARDTHAIVQSVTDTTKTNYRKVAITGSLFQRPEMVAHRQRFWDVPLELNPIEEAVATGAAWIARAERMRVPRDSTVVIGE